MTADAATSPPAADTRLRLLATLALAACAAAAVLAGVQAFRTPDSAWACALVVLLAAAATLLNLARALPAQNVITAAVLIALMSGIAEVINTRLHIPFGARTVTESLDPQLFGVAWPMPFIWIAAILNARGVARLVLRPWRKTSKYGLWLIGLACALTVGFDFNLEPFAAANGWWIWQMPQSVPAWQTAPWINFLAWAVVSLLILIIITPWLINKQQRARSAPPDFQPLLLWLLLNLLPAVGDAAHRLWLPVALALILTGAVTISAIRNAKW
jgi:uncharacterized membrane protein